MLDVDGLVVDWIAYKLYWSEHASLKVSGLNGEDVTVLLTNTKMKSLVIDPRQGYVRVFGLKILLKPCFGILTNLVALIF